MIERDLVTFLRGYAPVSNIVNQRIHPLEIPQGGEKPALTFQRISGPRIRSLTGFSGLQRPRIQLNCWDDRALGAMELAEAVKTLDGYRGMWGTTRIDQVVVANDLDDSEPELGLYVRKVDLIIWHKEA